MRRFALVWILLLSSCFEPSGSKSDQLQKLGSDSLFQRKNISQFHLQGSKKLVLTFDDGPTPRVTEALLQVLKKHQVKASFFILGASVSGQEQTLERMRSEGHVIANHSYSHQNLAKKLYSENIDALLQQVYTSHQQIAPFMNSKHRRYFRAPYGAWTSTHAEKLNQIQEIADYIGPVFWDLGGELESHQQGVRPQTVDDIFTAADWDCWTQNFAKNISPLSVEVCAAGYWKEIQRLQGGVVLMHDVDLRTVQMTDILIPQLKQEGYEFFTLEDLEVLEVYR